MSGMLRIPHFFNMGCLHRRKQRLLERRTLYLFIYLNVWYPREGCCTHLEHRVYRVWWLAATKGVQFTRADLEWQDGDYKWGTSETNVNGLRRWVINEIAYHKPGAQIPSRSRLARKHFDPTSEQRREIMEQYFRFPEGSKDQAKRWWKLVKERSLSAQDLAEELDRLRKEVGNDKEWRANVTRTAGRNGHESPLMNPGIDWVTTRPSQKI
jgi:hypothetical protein